MQRVQRVTSVAAPGWRATLGAYINLMKPHVTVLLLGTTLAAMVVANDGLPSFGIVLATLIGGAMAAGSANAINCYWDRDIDQIMTRTRNRTLPARRATETPALIFGLGLGAASFVILFRFVNLLSAVLAVSAILFYVLIYTMWLKRTTPQNIVIGGAAGAFPPMIGWAAASGSISIEPVLLFLIVFFWTPPHFWALSLNRTGDYARARVPMLPVVAGAAETRRQILLYALVLVPIGAAPWLLGYADALSGMTALLAGGVMVLLSWQLWVQGSGQQAARHAGRLFGFSILYLFILFAVLLAEGVWAGLAGRAMA